jgi:hypothetical protein
MSGAIGERTGQPSTVDMAIAEVVYFGTTPVFGLYVHYWLSAAPSSLKRRSRAYSNSMVESRIRTASRNQSEVAVGCCQSLVGQCNHDAKQCSDKDE